MIKRIQLEYARKRLFRGKAFIIYGPRQTGKTTFSEILLKEISQSYIYLNGDNIDTRESLSEPNPVKLSNLIGEQPIVFIDEAQRIPNIGLTIKIILDQIKNVQVIATGSSSLELAGNLNEPLTGRKYEMTLLPLAFSEMVNHKDYLTESRHLETRMIYGAYPEIIVDPKNAREHLGLIANSYLYKDLFELEQIKKPQLFEKLIKALALQVGNEVNINELSSLLKSDHKTIDKYISLLEQAFVIFQIPSFARNVRNELKKSRKIYFYDNGILNAVLGNFNGLNNRSDIGQLWENYLMAERRKLSEIKNEAFEMFFWRTTQQQEIDYIEEGENGLKGFEFKWNEKRQYSFSKTFLRAYPNTETQVVSRSNYQEFLL